MAWPWRLAADSGDKALTRAAELLGASRPTAINLRWAIDRCVAALNPRASSDRVEAAWSLAAEVADEDVAQNAALGGHGLALIRAAVAKAGGRRLNILTHCNAGWLATVEWGTATAPIYLAQAEGIDLHVYVDETRPRNQGASLTAWELGQHGVPHTVIPDNTGGHLMQHGLVDMVIVGTDRTTATGDVCNKIGTYLKALAAFDNNVPFYVAAPSPSIDFAIRDGLREIPIEERSPLEVTHMQGMTAAGRDRQRQNSSNGIAGRQLRVRRHAGPACHGSDHRARRACGDGGSVGECLPGAGADVDGRCLRGGCQRFIADSAASGCLPKPKHGRRSSPDRSISAASSASRARGRRSRPLSGCRRRGAGHR